MGFYTSHYKSKTNFDPYTKQWKAWSENYVPFILSLSNGYLVKWGPWQKLVVFCATKAWHLKHKACSHPRLIRLYLFVTLCGLWAPPHVTHTCRSLSRLRITRVGLSTAHLPVRVVLGFPSPPYPLDLTFSPSPYANHHKVTLSPMRKIRPPP